jgi:hypothetical protein
MKLKKGLSKKAVSFFTLIIYDKYKIVGKVQFLAPICKYFTKADLAIVI